MYAAQAEFITHVAGWERPLPMVFKSLAGAAAAESWQGCRRP